MRQRRRAKSARRFRLIDTGRSSTSFPISIHDAVIDALGRAGAPIRSSCDGAAFALPLARFGETLVGIQPARGYNIDPKETYHSPDLVPPHGYLAFYAFLREVYGADAVVHMGKHGNLEWLPGKALALSETCYPEAVFGPLPHLYPFIVNDPGEGTQAKRRTSRRHHRPPDPAADAGRKLRAAEGSRSAGRRILRGGRRRSAPAEAAEDRRSSIWCAISASTRMPASRRARRATWRSTSSTPISAT